MTYLDDRVPFCLSFTDKIDDLECSLKLGSHDLEGGRQRGRTCLNNSHTCRVVIVTLCVEFMQGNEGVITGIKWNRS